MTNVVQSFHYYTRKARVKVPLQAEMHRVAINRFSELIT